MPGDEMTLDEVLAEVDKKIKAALEQFKTELLKELEPRLVAAKKPFKIVNRQPAS